MWTFKATSTTSDVVVTVRASSRAEARSISRNMRVLLGLQTSDIFKADASKTLRFSSI